ncbi:MAG: 23S rRNA (uracil(1939)-C(5))-methyltransferase RlmD, partial [Bacillota bacterium]|nr:23S rRNA (uracil(1939)-C(5))-methyltransferase RlmD [Bacillota bacterium]
RYANLGVGYCEGKEVKIKNALIGQTVEVNLSKIKSKTAKGKVNRVIKRADYEIDAKCIHYDNCGGCSRQTVPIEKQLELKNNMVKDLFERNEIPYEEFEPIEKSPIEYNYRNKMEYSFGDESYGGELNLGMHKKGKFYDVINTTSCLIATEDSNKIQELVLEFARKTGKRKYHIKKHEGYFRHLSVRKGFNTGEILVGIVTTTQEEVNYDELVKDMLNLKLDGTIVGILRIKNDGWGDVVAGEYDILYGHDYYFEELLGLKFKVSFYSFFQTNPLGAEVLYSVVKDYLGNAKDKNIMELFSGTGTIGQIISENSKEVFGVELINDAVEMANENVMLNGINNCHFIQGDLFKEVDKLDFKPDIIIVDPPRYGIPNKAFKKILDFNVKEMIYVSCNPQGLMDNLKLAIEMGYKVTKVRCIDMFPHTPHVETVVKLHYNGR